MLTPAGMPVHPHPMPLYTTAQLRYLEQRMAAALPPGTLMARAGNAAASLARAIAPHARSIWVACGPGNNGGDGLMAAAVLAPWARAAGVDLSVSWCGQEAHVPPDAHRAWQRAVAAGVVFVEHPPDRCDLAIDALLGMGARPPTGCSATASRLWAWLRSLPDVGEQVLSLDTPSGLCSNTGAALIARNPIRESANGLFCLTFLGLKPGLFTANGRDWAGQIWLDDLGLGDMLGANPATPAPTAWLSHSPATAPVGPRGHNTHKGQLGDVWVLGGQGPVHGQGMVGAAVLAARAALHGGAGRVLLALLDPEAPSWDPMQPELMLRNAQDLLSSATPLPGGTWVVGCGGGSSIAAHLPQVVEQADRLVLDADALNAVADSTSLQNAVRQRGMSGHITVITPHPLEAARLLRCTTAAVQADRMDAAWQLAHRFQCVCVLKGSGTVMATPSGLVHINPTGNDLLSTAGTGDVLAGAVGAALSRASGRRRLAGTDVHATAARESSEARACEWLDAEALPTVASAVWSHGLMANTWPTPSEAHQALTASALACAISPAASAPLATAPPTPMPTSPPRPPAE